MCKFVCLILYQLVHLSLNKQKMKKIIFVFTFSVLTHLTFGQNKLEAEKLVDEGIAYHDKGDYEGAISKYDKALELDKDNLLAMAEKAFSLLSIKKYDESIFYCKKSIELYPNDKTLKTIFVTYGNALDGLEKTDKSIDIYNEGIKMFPDYYQLYYNKGITLSNVKRNEEAILCFQKAAILNPKHASSNNAIARLLHIQDRNIPSLLAFCRFLVLEPQSERAQENLKFLQKIVNGNVTKNSDKSITISINPISLEEKGTKNKQKENYFGTTELILSMDAALDYDEKNAKKSDVEQFIRKFETVCASLKETKKDNFGFYWEYYTPYFIEIYDKKMIETFGYIVFASSEKKEINKWLEDNKEDVDKFYKWSKNFEFKTKNYGQ